ncbi:RICIN domain-containing protein [Actinoplanes sp. URMC 104]|uniref:RICIN domain-containing protein n=1 Tax=Actinoplanes sp. URMC 104 TaxID=3423409 RepID=UPI003F1B3ED1
MSSGTGLGVGNMSTAGNARVLQWVDNGTAEHLWTAIVNGSDLFRLRNPVPRKGPRRRECGRSQRRSRHVGGRQRKRRSSLADAFREQRVFRIQCGNGGRVPCVTGHVRPWPARRSRSGTVNRLCRFG